MMVEENNVNSVFFSVPFSSTDTALLVQEVLNVDKELQGSRVHREITAVGENLHIKVNGAELKKVRVVVNSIIKNISLVVKTLDQFPKAVNE